MHTVYDAGGPVDCSTQHRRPGAPSIAANLANTQERVPLPRICACRVPGIAQTPTVRRGDTGTAAPTGVVFPPQTWGTTQGWQGLLGQNSFIEFGMKPFNAGENGGINGQVIYASTRPFDDPALSLQLSWEPGVPRVKVNLYSKAVDASRQREPDARRHHHHHELGRLGAGLPRDANGNLDGRHRRQAVTSRT